MAFAMEAGAKFTTAGVYMHNDVKNDPEANGIALALARLIYAEAGSEPFGGEVSNVTMQ